MKKPPAPRSVKLSPTLTFPDSRGRITLKARGALCVDPVANLSILRRASSR